MLEPIAITGIGLVTPLGLGREAVWEGLLGGRSGIGPVESFDTSAYKVKLGGEVRGFRPEEHFRRLSPGQVGRASQMAVAAAYEAVGDAGLDLSSLPAEKMGVVMGTTSGEPQEVERFDDRYVAGELGEVGREFMDRYPCHV
ncbi:MAG: beta-ketoacyl-[acyl-carrier-protein] synthase family protein, partial [Acidobacteria bacterium]|nr:beta-ketoacyl-[acyl-carrier-protein] synthase family protein [Acidobacteriota bacterium]